MNIFNISSAQDFFETLVLPEYEDFKRDNSSQRRAISSIIFAYHFYEKVHSEKFHKNVTSMSSDDIENFDAARELVNGTKHISMKVTTSVQPGYSADFSSDYQRPLSIEVGGHQKGVDELLDEMITYWKTAKAGGAF